MFQAGQGRANTALGRALPLRVPALMFRQLGDLWKPSSPVNGALQIVIYECPGLMQRPQESVRDTEVLSR